MLGRRAVPFAVAAAGKPRPPTPRWAGFFLALRPVEAENGGVSSVAYIGSDMHAHFSALAAAQAFLAVIIIGSLWRLVAAHLTANSKPAISRVGQIMLFQY